MIEFFLAGLLLAFSPCVLPTIPIVASMLTRNNKYDLLIYVVSCALTYAAFGALIGATGVFLQPYFENPYVLICASIVLIFFALWEFGMCNIPMNWTMMDYFKDAKFGPALWGVFSVLVVSPCVTPCMGVILSYISTTGDIKLGFIKLFCLGLGINTPLVVIGYFGNQMLIRNKIVRGVMKYNSLLIGVMFLALAGTLLVRAVDNPTFSNSSAQLQPANEMPNNKATLSMASYSSHGTVTVYTATWCGVCQEFERNEVPKIRAAGISVNYVDVSNGGSPTGYVPYIVVKNHGKTTHNAGYTSASTIIAAAR